MIGEPTATIGFASILDGLGVKGVPGRLKAVSVRDCSGLVGEFGIEDVGLSIP
ncbi:hypothetical protein EDD29_5008 [Actinocorallia herbida]|uniref:Uncharacterized protein n=1 Tax=Actinocorallia herbida TaxID=58109 RepID=A0A3N1D1K0_9ACTN|nr:hypothetical protein [Actinocorallia herbida]ROO87401.1 hypothetical protein EDD29_5008 [Actinocorallia herbida]